MARASDETEVKQACVDAHAEGQRLVLDGKLVEGGARLGSCAREACPGPVRAECEHLKRDVDAAAPSVVLRVRLDGDDASLARVELDGRPLGAKLDGRAIVLDPGEHMLRVEIEGAEAVERRFVVVAGEKHRAIVVDLTRRPPTTPTTPTTTTTSVATDAPPHARASFVERPVPTATWALGAVGLGALGSFAYFAALGRVEQARLEAGCAPACTSSALSPMRRDYWIADVSLGVSLLALGGAAWTFLARPSVTVERRTAWVSIDMQPRQLGVVFAGRF